jgi:hypothetical protein
MTEVGKLKVFKLAEVSLNDDPFVWSVLGTNGVKRGMEGNVEVAMDGDGTTLSGWDTLRGCCCCC